MNNKHTPTYMITLQASTRLSGVDSIKGVLSCFCLKPRPTMTTHCGVQCEDKTLTTTCTCGVQFPQPYTLSGRMNLEGPVEEKRSGALPIGLPFVCWECVKIGIGPLRFKPTL